MPEPKKLTDEELKKFGIHMASRLGPESSQGHNNWADIDDDDDDWAPDTITWTDGTKVTVHENTPPPLEPVPIAAREKPRLVEGTRSPAPLASLPPPGTSSPSTKPATLPSGKGLILKGGSSADKPALVAKPPAPASPAKSPWAKLPPIDKASPAGAEPLPSIHGHLPVRDPRLQSISPPPAREIAADDFSRSTWREGPAAGPNQLFNSHSGRYEPVGDRRGSFRSEAHLRQPAVLQRPSQSDHPEPSAAFQTHRTQQEGPFGRRRGSSNLSGGNFPLRPSFGPHDVPPGHRRGSLTASIESANSPQPRHISPVEPQGGHRYQSNQSWQPRASPSLTHASLHQPTAAGPPPAEVAPEQPQSPEDFEFQKRIMHEKRELAMQRRREQEAREEEEKQKRIQAKLAAMGPAPERKSAKKESSHDEPHAVPVQIQQRLSSEPDHATAAASADNQTSVTSEQGDQPGKHGSGSVEVPSESPPSQTRNRQEPKSISEQADGLGASVPANSRTRPESKAQWGQPPAPQADRFTASWGASGQQQPSSSVWAPNNLRGLGNGTFNTHLGRGPVSPTTTTAQPARGPAPIAPPSAQRLSNIAAQQASAPGSGRPEPLRSKWANSVTEGDKVILEQNRARMAEQDRELADRGMTLADSVPEIKDTWRPHTNTATLRSNAPDASARSGPPAGPMRPDYPSGPAAVLPPASSTPQSRSRFFPTPTRDVRQESAPPAEPLRPNSPSPPPPDTVGHPAFDGDAHHPHVSLPRPQPVVRLPPSAAAPTAPAATRGANFSWSHPAPYKDATGQVPTGPAGHTREWHTQPAGHGPITGASQDSSRTKGWGEKFRNLFSDHKVPPGHKVTSPSQATFVDASSRSVFHDEGSRNNFATVSLPRTPTKAAAPQQVIMDSQLFLTAVHSARKDFNDTTGAFMVKPVSEECFEAQEMGSLPAVNIPREAPEAAWHPAAAPPKDRTAPRRLMNSDISSSPLHWVPQDMGSNGSPEYRIKFPGMEAMRTVPAPALRTRSNPRRASGRGARASQGARGGKNADANSQSGDTPPPRPSRGGRGSYRSRGGGSGGRDGPDWSRRTSSAQANQ